MRASYEYDIDWGDGIISNTGESDKNCQKDLTHDYKIEGSYQITAKTKKRTKGVSHGLSTDLLFQTTIKKNQIINQQENSFTLYPAENKNIHFANRLPKLRYKLNFDMGVYTCMDIVDKDNNVIVGGKPTYKKAQGIFHTGHSENFDSTSRHKASFSISQNYFAVAYVYDEIGKLQTSQKIPLPKLTSVREQKLNRDIFVIDNRKVSAYIWTDSPGCLQFIINWGSESTFKHDLQDIKADRSCLKKQGYHKVSFQFSSLGEKEVIVYKTHMPQKVDPKKKGWRYHYRLNLSGKVKFDHSGVN